MHMPTIPLTRCREGTATTLVAAAFELLTPQHPCTLCLRRGGEGEQAEQGEQGAHWRHLPGGSLAVEAAAYVP